ncbi:U7 snRNA-associated Sm-like protein LSm11 [Venturia canescens]|uniref:U7 snRNA-associated Sm-like protein LSm11 n=1 Tax=Venturia canescens TaxID=32260 RepID=UPI001C9C062A|nr:U7 snRNA-associated Sm-like protein LSm11 [Venturia canescens]XP_043274661.1 U7 snRNA-associated Sm-like protein LSm11 [Venturia canescens]
MEALEILGNTIVVCSMKMADEGNSSSDESLDLSSKKFDPVKALYSQKLVIPMPSAPVYDNLSKYESVLTGSAAGPSKAKEKSSEADKGDAPKRKFLPHQGPVQARNRDGWTGAGEKNILGKMKNTLGPLSMMYECMEKKTRVKVYTRSARGVRGFVEAYVAAFDKHWNLALQDCLEVWTRKVKRKAPALGLPEVVKFEVRDEDVPKVIVKDSNGKEETLERHVPQMLLRGEQIAIIVKIN